MNPCPHHGKASGNKKYGTADYERTAQMRLEGKTYKQIMAATGMGLRTVQNIFDKYDLVKSRANKVIINSNGYRDFDKWDFSQDNLAVNG